MDCRDVDGRLHAYLEREVPSREDGLIRGHLSLCTRCRDHASAIRGRLMGIDFLFQEPAEGIKDHSLFTGELIIHRPATPDSQTLAMMKEASCEIPKKIDTNTMISTSMTS